MSINSNTYKTPKSFEEMAEKSVDAKAAKAQLAFADWKETYPKHFVVEGKLLINRAGLKHL